MIDFKGKASMPNMHQNVSLNNRKTSARHMVDTPERHADLAQTR